MSTLYGKEFEPIIIEFYSKFTNNKVLPVPFTPHNTIEFLGATPDGIINSDFETKKQILVEIKNPLHSEWNSIPVEYMAQMQL